MAKFAVLGTERQGSLILAPPTFGGWKDTRVVLAYVASTVLLIFALFYFASNRACKSPPLLEGEPGPGASFPLLLNASYGELLELHRAVSKVAGRDGVPFNSIMWSTLQAQYYAATATLLSVSTICEAGFGVGHSTLLFLSMNSRAEVLTFDPLSLGPMQQAGLDFIKASRHSSRWRLVQGEAAKVVPEFAAAHKDVRCDVVVVGGRQSTPVPLKDFEGLGQMGHAGTVALFDDATQEEMEAAQEKGVVRLMQCMNAGLVTDPRFASQPQRPKSFCAVAYASLPLHIR